MFKQKNSPTCEPSGSIRIYRISDLLKGVIVKVAGKTGVSTSRYLKPVIGEILESYPQEMKCRKECEPCKMEIEITSISQSRLEQINNIAANIGVSPSDFIKVELARKMNTIPDYMKVAV